LLLLQGRTDEAEEQFRAALKTQPHHPEARRCLATILAQRGKTRQALRHLRIAVSFKPDLRTRMDYAMLLHQTGDDSGAAAQLRQALLAQPDAVEALNNLAWLLATCADDKVRNGAEAVRCAERASRLPAPDGMCVMGTLAAAYAEAGRFKDAVATAEKAVEKENAAGQARFAAINAQLLALYRAGRPCHEPPPSENNPFSLDGDDP